MNPRISGLLLPPLAVLIALALFAGPGAGQAQAGETLSPTPYKNLQLGFRFHTFQGWTAFPPEPGEKVTVVHFRTEKASRGMGYDPHCYIAILGKDSVATVKDYMAEERGYLGVNCAERKYIAESKMLPGAIQWEFSFSGINCSGAGIGAEFRRETDTIAVIYVCEVGLMKKYRNNFIASLCSFKLIDPKVAEEDDASSLDTNELPIEKRFKEFKASCPPGWNVYLPKDFKKYIFYYNCEQADLNAVIVRLKLIRPQFEKYFPPVIPKFTAEAAPIVRVCKDQRDFVTYSGMSEGVGGYWSPGQGELVVFKKSEYFGTMKDLFFEILQHEGFHQYIHYACGTVDPCITFNEGPAEFFGAFEPGPGGMVPTLDNAMRKPVIKGAVNSGGHVPLKTILYYSQSEYYSNAMTCYAEGWALVSFLMMGRKTGGANFKKEWEEIIPKYFNYLQGEVKKEYEKVSGKVTGEGSGKEGEGGDAPKPGGDDREGLGKLDSPKKRANLMKLAMDYALEGIDMDALEEAWKLWVKKSL